MRTDSNISAKGGTNLTGSSASGTAHQSEAPGASRPQRAASISYFDIANTILGSSGDLDEVLLSAARDGDFNKLEQLLCQRNEIIVDIDCKDKRTGNTPLIWAAKKGNAKMIQLLLRHGADPTLHNYEAQTAVEVATSATKTVLLDSVSRPNECTHRLLLQAAWQGNLEVIRRLLRLNKSLDINCQSAEGLTPLLLVAKDVQLFERLGAQLNWPYHPVEVAEILMKARANILAQDNDGKTCLHYAAQCRAEVAEKLVHAFIMGGSDTDQLDKRQYAAIHWASHFGNVGVVSELLDGGSEVNCRGFAGLTPLHISAHNDHQHTAVVLLQHGADITLTDDRGMTAVDLAKTRKMKSTLREAWTEATQKTKPADLGPVRVPSRDESRLSMQDENPKRRKGEVVFDGLVIGSSTAQRPGQSARPGLVRGLSNAEKARRAEQQMLQDLENGRYTPAPVYSRESTRPLGTMRTKMPPILPQISMRCSSPTVGSQPSESPAAGSKNAAPDDLRRSLEDGRNMLGQRSQSRRGPVRVGRLNGSTPHSTYEEIDSVEDNYHGVSIDMRPVAHRRTGSDPFATSFADLAATVDNIINRRGRSVSSGDGGSCETGEATMEHRSLLRTPLDHDTTMCINIPAAIPERRSSSNQACGFSFETALSTSHTSALPAQIIPLPPNSSRILPPTPTFLTQSSYLAVERALAKTAQDSESSSSQEPSPRSDEDDDNKIRMVLANPMELLRSRSLLKEEFILAESRPSDIVMGSTGSDPTSSSSSLSTSSSSPRDGSSLGFASRTSHRASDPSLVTLTLREKTVSSGLSAGVKLSRRSDPSLVRLCETRFSATQTSGPCSDFTTKGQKGCGVPMDINSKTATHVLGSPPAGAQCLPSCVKSGVGVSGAVESGEASSSSGKSTCSSSVVRSQSLKTTDQRRDAEKQGRSFLPEAAKEKIKRTWSVGNVAGGAAAKADAAGVAVPTRTQKTTSSSGAPSSGKVQIAIVRDSFQGTDHVIQSDTSGLQKSPTELDKKLQSVVADSSQVSLEKSESTSMKESNSTKSGSSGMRQTPADVLTVGSDKTSEREAPISKNVCAKASDKSKSAVGSESSDGLKPGVVVSSVCASPCASLVPSNVMSKTVASDSVKVDNKISLSTTASDKTCADHVKCASPAGRKPALSAGQSAVARQTSSISVLSSSGPTSAIKPATVSTKNSVVSLVRKTAQTSCTKAVETLKASSMSQPPCPETSKKVTSDLASSKMSSSVSTPCVTAVTGKNLNKAEKGTFLGSLGTKVNDKMMDCQKPGFGKASAAHAHTSPGTRLSKDLQVTSEVTAGERTGPNHEAPSYKAANLSKAASDDCLANQITKPIDTPRSLSRSQAPQTMANDTLITQSKGVVPVAKSEHSLQFPAQREKMSSKSQGDVWKEDHRQDHDIEPLVKITVSNMDPRSVAALRCPSDPAVLTSTPIIINPFEHLSMHQSVKDNSPRHMAEKSNKDAGSSKARSVPKGRPSRIAKKGKERRPVSGASRQPSARRRGTKTKDGKIGDGVETRPRSGKTPGRVRSGKRKARKQADKQEDIEVAQLAEIASKGDVALISGIGWHVAASCVDTSDIRAASSIHYSSSDFEDSDLELLEDIDVPHQLLDVKHGQLSVSPRFREVKSGRDKTSLTIPVMPNDGFPPMNLDMTVSSTDRLQTSGQFAADGAHDLKNTFTDLEHIKDITTKEMLLRKLTPIPEVPSVAGVSEAIARFDHSLKEGQLSQLLEGVAQEDGAAILSRGDPGTGSSIIRRETASERRKSKESGRDSVEQVMVNAAGVKEILSVNRDIDVSHKVRNEGTTEIKKPKKERKFSESKKDEEEIDMAIDEILSATSTSMSSTLKSTSTLKATSTLRSGALTFTEGDHHLLVKLKLQNKESPFHAHRENSPEDEGPKTTRGIVEEGECLQPDDDPNRHAAAHVDHVHPGKGQARLERSEVRSTWSVEEEAKHLIKVMNSFRLMELHAGSNNSHSREPVVRSESHRVAKVASGQDRVPLIRPSSAGTARSRGKFQELKKGSANNIQEQAAHEKKIESVEEPEVIIGAQGGFEDVVEALAGDITHSALGNTAGSETMCSHLSGRRGSRSSSASTTDSMEEMIQWKKGNVLGKGAFGTVWCGLTNEGELIAVKQIELTTTDRQKAETEYEKVQEEVELLKTLSHSNIVGYLGTSFEDNIVSIFMQFVPGGSIASILARFGALDEAVFRRYTRQILQGVEYLHSNDVIHRDIKGGNVMLMPNGVIKLIDFGCAKRLCINLSLSQTQILRSMKGTPYWMAPEVVNESGHGKKSDIWSIGCTVFEMATRKPPWADMNPMAAIFAIGSDKQVPRLSDKFSAEAISFTNRCLTRDQNKRPSASELLTDPFMLERILKK